MKFLFCILFLLSTQINAQLLSGEYGELRIAYDAVHKYVTGYYANYSGLDETTNKPKFSCEFYFEGVFKNGRANITSYYPNDTIKISGELELADSNGVKIHLQKEHGGCWNVQHFVDTPIEFKLTQMKSWIAIRYIPKERIYMRTGPPSNLRQSTYVEKDDIVYVQKIVEEMAHCYYYGENIEKDGWIRIDDLNKLPFR